MAWRSAPRHRKSYHGSIMMIGLHLQCDAPHTYCSEPASARDRTQVTKKHVFLHKWFESTIALQETHNIVQAGSGHVPANVLERLFDLASTSHASAGQCLGKHAVHHYKYPVTRCCSPQHPGSTEQSGLRAADGATPHRTSTSPGYGAPGRCPAKSTIQLQSKSRRAP